MCEDPWCYARGYRTMTAGNRAYGTGRPNARSGRQRRGHSL